MRVRPLLSAALCAALAFALVGCVPTAEERVEPKESAERAPSKIEVPRPEGKPVAAIVVAGENAEGGRVHYKLWQVGLDGETTSFPSLLLHDRGVAMSTDGRRVAYVGLSKGTIGEPAVRLLDFSTGKDRVVSTQPNAIGLGWWDERLVVLSGLRGWERKDGGGSVFSETPLDLAISVLPLDETTSFIGSKNVTVPRTDDVRFLLGYDERIYFAGTERGMRASRDRVWGYDLSSSELTVVADLGLASWSHGRGYEGEPEVLLGMWKDVAPDPWSVARAGLPVGTLSSKTEGPTTSSIIVRMRALLPHRPKTQRSLQTTMGLVAHVFDPELNHYVAGPSGSRPATLIEADTRTGATSTLVTTDRDGISPLGYVGSGGDVVYAQNGEVWLYERASGKSRQLATRLAGKKNAHFIEFVGTQYQ